MKGLRACRSQPFLFLSQIPITITGANLDTSLTIKCAAGSTPYNSGTCP